MIGKTMLHYLITEKLGQGGMGDGFHAGCTNLSRQVAIKVLYSARPRVTQLVWIHYGSHDQSQDANIRPHIRSRSGHHTRGSSEIAGLFNLSAEGDHCTRSARPKTGLLRYHPVQKSL